MDQKRRRRYWSFGGSREPVQTRPYSTFARPAKTGRPTTYGQWVYDMLAEYDVNEPSMSPGTNAQIARFLGIGPTTLTSWLNEYPDLLKAILVIRREADDQVEASLFQRARGYEVKARDVKTEKFVVSASSIIAAIPDLEGRDDIGDIVLPGVKITETEKTTHVAADVGAAKFWLTNRAPEDWTEKKTLEVVDERWGKLLDKMAAEIHELPPDQYEEIEDDRQSQAPAFDAGSGFEDPG